MIDRGNDLIRGTAQYYARYRMGYTDELFDRLVAPPSI